MSSRLLSAHGANALAIVPAQDIYFCSGNTEVVLISDVICTSWEEVEKKIKSLSFTVEM
jgi:hypothetical protein